MLQKIVDFGKKAVLVLSLASLASCLPQHTYAKRDYDKYPGHKKEIALYNVRHILRDVCTESLVTEDYLHCKQTLACSKGEYYRYPHSSRSSYTCTEWQRQNLTLDWDDISDANCGSSNPYSTRNSTWVYLSTSEGERYISANSNPRQCEDLKEAIDIYTRHNPLRIERERESRKKREAKERKKLEAKIRTRLRTDERVGHAFKFVRKTLSDLCEISHIRPGRVYCKVKTCESYDSNGICQEGEKTETIDTDWSKFNVVCHEHWKEPYNPINEAGLRPIDEEENWSQNIYLPNQICERLDRAIGCIRWSHKPCKF